MPTVEKFGSSMLEKYVKKQGWKFLRDSDGDYRVAFSHDDSVGCELTLWLIAGGQKDEILMVLVSSNKRIQKNDWPRVIGLCNTWNRTRRWPKAYLHIEDPAKDVAAEIRLEGQLDLERGVHQELVNDFCDTIWQFSLQFWNWAHKEQGL